jgi:hypothetical protein
MARMGDRRGLNRASVGRSEGTSPLGRPRRSLEANIKMDFQEVGWGSRGRIALTQDRERWRAVVNAVMNFRVP